MIAICTWTGHKGTLDMMQPRRASLLGQQIRGLPILDLRAQGKEEAIREIVQDLVSRRLVEDDLAESYIRGFLEREEAGSTAQGQGFAVPHTLTALDKSIVRLARSKAGIDWGSPDGEPVHVVYLLLGAYGRSGDALRMSEHLSRVTRDERMYSFILEADSGDIADRLDEMDL